MGDYRILNDNKICFIACVNDEAQFENFCMAEMIAGSALSANFK